MVVETAKCVWGKLMIIDHEESISNNWRGKFLIFLGKAFPLRLYRGADKSLARPGRKRATFPVFYGTWKFITTFTRDHQLSLP